MCCGILEKSIGALIRIDAILSSRNGFEGGLISKIPAEFAEDTLCATERRRMRPTLQLRLGFSTEV